MLGTSQSGVALTVHPLLWLYLCLCWLQEQRNILALAVGLKGIAAIRAVLSWAPVQAHATSHRVTAYYVTKSPQTAAFLAEWDQWREAGVSRTAAMMASAIVVAQIDVGRFKPPRMQVTVNICSNTHGKAS